MKIGVLYGGKSSERPVSLNSAKGVIAALKRKGHDVVEVDFQDVGQLESLANEQVDMVFNALHGGAGEDGHVQAYLDMLRIPYLGSDAYASAMAMDKWEAKGIFRKVGIPVAEDTKLTKDTWTPEATNPLWDESKTYVIKPNREGSTIGMTFASGKEDIQKGIELAFEYDTEILVEEFIKGREFTVGVFGENTQEYALPVIEIVTKAKHYDYHAKYTKGMTDYLVPADLPESLSNQMKQFAVSAHQALGCRTYSRVDIMLDEQTNIPYVLEINTLPGMTETSLFPKAAKSHGLEYDDMVEALIVTGMKNQTADITREIDQTKKELTQSFLQHMNRFYQNAQ